MQALRTSSLKARAPIVRCVRQYQTSSNPPQPAGKETSSGQPTQRSSVLVPAAAILAVIGGIALYNTRQTGNPDGIAKAMAKSGLPSQRDGGLGKMEIEDPNRKLVMGGKEVETEPEGRKPPTFKKA